MLSLSTARQQLASAAADWTTILQKTKFVIHTTIVTTESRVMNVYGIFVCNGSLVFFHITRSVTTHRGRSVYHALPIAVSPHDGSAPVRDMIR